MENARECFYTRRTNDEGFLDKDLRRILATVAHNDACSFRCDDLPPWTHAAQRLPVRRIRAPLYEPCLEDRAWKV